METNDKKDESFEFSLGWLLKFKAVNPSDKTFKLFWISVILSLILFVVLAVFLPKIAAGLGGIGITAKVISSFFKGESG